MLKENASVQTSLQQTTVPSQGGVPRISIFVSSPGDVKEERDVVREVIQALNQNLHSRYVIDAYFWESELFPATTSFQEHIKGPESCDLFLCIVWSRLGTPLDPKIFQRRDGTPYASGTEYEFELAMQAYVESGSIKPKIYIFHNTSTPPNPFQITDRKRQDEALAQVRAKEDFLKKWTIGGEDGTTFIGATNAYCNSYEFKTKLVKLLDEFLEEFTSNKTMTKNALERRVLWPHNPYRGLESFDFEHAPLFQGREAVTDTIFTMLTDRFREEKTPFLLISGSSGVGKSSLVRAGLLPKLFHAFETWNALGWRYAEFRPSDKKEEEKSFLPALARSLTAIAKSESKLPPALPELIEGSFHLNNFCNLLQNSTEEAAVRIETCIDAILKSMGRTEEKGPSLRICLFLDQMEEFFTTINQGQAYDEAVACFFNTLKYLLEKNLIVVVGTMRIDYLGYCENISSLLSLKAGKGYFHLGPPSNDEVARIINRPAKAAGMSFEKNVSLQLTAPFQKQMPWYL